MESPNQDKLSETKPKTKTKIKQKVRFRERKEDTEVFNEEEDHLVERGYSAPGPIPSKKLKLEKMKGERRKSDTQYLEKLSPYERDLMKRKLIIAPDGYIPNSVVRKRLGFVPPSTPVKKTDTWTIESIKLPVAEKPVKTIQTHEEEEEKWEKEIRPFSWGDDKESDEGGRKSSKNSPMKKMQLPLMRTSSTLSNLSTSSSRLGFTGTRKSTPTTPKYELKSKKFDLHRVDLDMGTPERMRRSVGTRSRERTKSFRLTNMVVDEQSTNVTFKEDSKLAHRKGLLPAAVDMDVIRRLLEEDFFPDLNGTASFDLIMQNLIRLLDTEDSELHAKICDYIMCIHRDIGIPDHYLDRIIGKLSLQLGGDNSSLKRFGLRTLKEIGADRQDVLAIILPRLIDAQEDIREEAKNVLAALSSVVNKEELLELMTSMGLTQQFDSKDEEEEALKALAMRLDIPFRSDSFTDWINNWVDDSSSIYDSEPEVKLDDIEKAWDGRQRKWKQDSLCLTESASRASTRMRELSFLSKGSRTPIPEVEENSSEEDLERKKTESQLSGRSSRHSGNRPKEKFDPRDSGLYKYYKDRYNREKEAEGKFNYKSMSKLFSRTQPGGADETDSQIGSLDSYSQIGDTLSTNDSGIVSIQDSGIGRDMSDSHGHTPYKASPRLIKEKIQTKTLSYRSRIDSHHKHNLSPVKSSSTGTIGTMSIKSSPREKDPDWVKFFQTPTALERKRMEMVKKDYTEGKIKPGSAAVINYINEGLPMLPGELGLRLLKSVKVCGDKDLAPLSDRQHRIESIPGKLGVHTKSEDKGQSKYGILQMQWTTAVPVPVSHDTYPERYSSMSDATSTLGGSSIGTYSIERPLPSIVHKYANTERSSTTQFIDELDYHRLPGSVYSPDYEWDYPIPPPPAKESRISVPYIRKEHDRYCKYYTVVKKKMQNLASKKKASTLEQQLLPKVEIKKALPERLKLPRELTRLSRVPSVLYPPLTLHQLMSART